MQAATTMRTRRSRRGFALLTVLGLVVAVLAIAVIMRASNDVGQNASQRASQDSRVINASRSGEVTQSKQVVRPGNQTSASQTGSAVQVVPNISPHVDDAVIETGISRSANLKPQVSYFFGSPMIEDVLYIPPVVTQQAFQFMEWNTWLPANSDSSNADCANASPQRVCLNP